MCKEMWIYMWSARAGQWNTCTVCQAYLFRGIYQQNWGYAYHCSWPHCWLKWVRRGQICWHSCLLSAHEHIGGLCIIRTRHAMENAVIHVCPGAEVQAAAKAQWAAHVRLLAHGMHKWYLTDLSNTRFLFFICKLISYWLLVEGPYNSYKLSVRGGSGKGVQVQGILRSGARSLDKCSSCQECSNPTTWRGGMGQKLNFFKIT